MMILMIIIAPFQVKVLLIGPVELVYLGLTIYYEK